MPALIVVDRLRRAHGHLAHLAAQLGCHGHRRRLLDQLLVAPLDRALAFAQMNAVAVVVGQDLDLDVPGAGDQLLKIDRVVAEGVERLTSRRGQGAGSSAGSLTTRIPLPPPPADALTSTG